MLFAINSVSNLQKNNAIYRRTNYLHVTENSSSKSVSCIFGVVLLLECEPRRQTNADLKMANETRVLIHAIVEAQLSCFFTASRSASQTAVVTLTFVRHASSSSKSQWCVSVPRSTSRTLDVKMLFIILV